jgi:hypothetical protein
VAAQRLEVTSAAEGALLGDAISSGIVAAAGLAFHAFTVKPAVGWLVDAGFQVTALAIMGAIVGRWR